MSEPERPIALPHWAVTGPHVSNPVTHEERARNIRTQYVALPIDVLFDRSRNIQTEKEEKFPNFPSGIGASETNDHRFETSNCIAEEEEKDL